MIQSSLYGTQGYIMAIMAPIRAIYDYRQSNNVCSY